jgi:SAM-dependent methyltransferase
MTNQRLFEKYYYGKPTFVDGTTEFHRLCSRHLVAGSKILEIGAGPSNPTSAHLSTIGDVFGVDISPEARTNKYLAGSQVYDGKDLPFTDASFDGCVSNYVLEHVEDPDGHFRQVARVLKPGGVYCFRTPNLWHYVALTARFLPHSFHLRFSNRLRGLEESAHDPYPTYYRANTQRRIVECCRGVGLKPLIVSMIEKEPSYGRLHNTIFYTMMMYERAVNSSHAFEPLRANILGVLRRAEQA